jgi:hypothetical protein
MCMVDLPSMVASLPLGQKAMMRRCRSAVAVVRNYYIPAPLVTLNASNQRRTGNNALDISPLNHNNKHRDSS